MKSNDKRTFPCFVSEGDSVSTIPNREASGRALQVASFCFRADALDTRLSRLAV